MNASRELFQNLVKFALPADIGRIASRSTSQADFDRVLTFINNFGLTKTDGIRKSAEIIRLLATTFEIEVVFADGAEGPGEFSVWDPLHPLMREWFAEKLMLKGYMSPAELAVVRFPEAGIEIFGIDDRELYKSHWRAARKLAQSQTEDLAALSHFQTVLSAQACVLSVDTRKLIEAQDDYEAAYAAWSEAPDGQDDTELKLMKEARSTWLNYLRLYVRWVGISIPNTAATEMQRFGFPLEEAAAGDQGDDYEERPSFLRGEPSKSEILTRLSEFLATALARTECDRAFLFLRRATAMLVSAVDLDMQMEEATEFLQAFYIGTAELRRSVEVLTSALSEIGEPVKLELPPNIDSLMRAAVDYNSLAMLRGVRMAENIASEMRRRSIDRAMVVQSGFQFPIIAGVLSRHYRIETLQVIPKIVGSEGMEAHRARLLAESDIDEENEKEPQIGSTLDRRGDGAGSAPASLQALQAQASRDWENGALSAHAGFLVSRCRRNCGVVLNVDCGEGKVLLGVARHCRSAFLIGLDNYSTNLIPSRRTPTELQVRVRTEGLSKRVILVNSLSRFLPFLDETFDLVLTDAIDLIFNAGECRTTLREFVRVLKPNGELRILTTKWAHLVERVLRREGLIAIAKESIESQDASGVVLLFEAKRPPRFVSLAAGSAASK